MEHNRPPIKPRKTVAYSEVAYRAIKYAILTGQLEAEKPLIEEALAAMLNISRTPVREALTILEHEGLIGPRHGRGLYVRPITRDEFVDMFSANEIVTTELARRAARLVTEEQLQVMGEQIHRETYYAAEQDLVRLLEARREFLRQLGEAADNTVLAAFLIGNQERIDLYMLGSSRTIHPDSLMRMGELLARQHQALLQALQRHDLEEAGRLVIAHAQWLRERFADWFGREEESVEDIYPGLGDL